MSGLNLFVCYWSPEQISNVLISAGAKLNMSFYQMKMYSTTLRTLVFGLILISVFVQANTVQTKISNIDSLDGDIKVTEVIYPPAQSTLDVRDRDLIEILRSALEKTENTDGPFILHSTNLDMNPARYRYEVKHGDDLNIIWAVATKKMEEDLLSIKIPLRKGILGYRLLLIDKSNQDKFSSIASLEELQQLSAGQNASWIDTEILHHNGFNVITGTNYEGLFKMLMSGRFAFFPRGINEVYSELSERQYQFPNMAIEKSILLYYPLPMFLFVNKKNKTLADRIERGMKIMIEDGSFDEIFFKYNREYIDMIQLDSRKVFKINNPFLSDNIPFDRKELWYDLLYTRDH